MLVEVTHDRRPRSALLSVFRLMAENNVLVVMCVSAWELMNETDLVREVVKYKIFEGLPTWGCACCIACMKTLLVVHLVEMPKKMLRCS